MSTSHDVIITPSLALSPWESLFVAYLRGGPLSTLQSAWRQLGLAQSEAVRPSILGNSEIYEGPLQQ